METLPKKHYQWFFSEIGEGTLDYNSKCFKNKFGWKLGMALLFEGYLLISENLSAVPAAIKAALD